MRIVWAKNHSDVALTFPLLHSWRTLRELLRPQESSQQCLVNPARPATEPHFQPILNSPPNYASAAQIRLVYAGMYYFGPDFGVTEIPFHVFFPCTSSVAVHAFIRIVRTTHEGIVAAEANHTAVRLEMLIVCHTCNFTARSTCPQSPTCLVHVCPGLILSSLLIHSRRVIIWQQEVKLIAAWLRHGKHCPIQLQNVGLRFIISNKHQKNERTKAYCMKSSPYSEKFNSKHVYSETRT